VLAGRTAKEEQRGLGNGAKKKKKERKKNLVNGLAELGYLPIRVLLLNIDGIFGLLGLLAQFREGLPRLGWLY